MINIDELIESSKTLKEFLRFVYRNENNLKEIEELTIFLDDIYLNVSIQQRAWHVYNKTQDIPKCDCGKYQSVRTANFHFIPEGEVYSLHCGDKKCKNAVANEIRKNSCLKKYGTENVAQCKEIQKKMEATSLKKYGTKNPIQSKEIQERYKESLMKKYGVDNISKSDIIKEKKIQTCLKNFGVEHPSQSSGVIKTRRKNNLEKYGHEEFCNTPEFKEMSKKSMIDRYGVANPSNSKSISEKRVKVFQDRFGCKNPTMNPDIAYKIKIKRSKLRLKELYSLNIPEYSIIEVDELCRDLKLKCHNCQKEFEISFSLLRNRFFRESKICTVCHPVKPFGKSEQQNELRYFIEGLGFSTKNDDRTVLNGKEIDILVPDKNIGFEYNSFYWHGDDKKDVHYHYDKKKLANDKQVNLIHIWEDDWHEKKNIVMSRIKNILGVSERNIFARKCEIRSLDTRTYEAFLIRNHIQGSVLAAYRYGLFYENELVSLMSLGERNKQFELKRFCNKLDCRVVGGFSKLLKHFHKENPSIKEILSYGDVDWIDLNDNVYLRNGFVFSGISQPGYHWILKWKKVSRHETQVKKLHAQGFEGTEDSIMRERGGFKIHNSGNARYILKFYEDI